MTPREIRLAAVCVLLGVAAKIGTRVARANLSDIPPRLGFVFGVLPNFAAGFYLPFLGIVLQMHLPPLARIGRSPMRRFASWAVVSVAGLFAWEFAQRLFWGYAIDPNDLAASILGAALATAVYSVFLMIVRSGQPSSIAPPPLQ